MKKIHVIFQFDTEDFITPEADDILLNIISILDKFGVKGSFCLVAEKVRALEKRGRTDVLEALKRHDIGYHSNYHSMHPVISEYLKDKGWDEGVKEVKKREKPGLEYLKKMFGVKPSVFIQPGGSWAPETPYALKEMDVPVYADGIFQEEPVWFCGALCLRYAMNFPEHSTFADLNGLKSRFDNIYNSKIAKGGILVIFMHPCMFVTEKFWDGVNFSHGRNPSPEEVAPAPLRRRKDVEESLQVFQFFLEFILEHQRVEVITYRDLPSLFQEPIERKLSLDQIFVLSEKASKHNDWQVINKISISPSETLQLFIELIARYLGKNMEPPEFIPIRFTLGPTFMPPENSSLSHMHIKDFLNASTFTKHFMEVYGRVPSAIKVNGVEFGPSLLLEAAAKAILHYSRQRSLPEIIKLEGLSNVPEVAQRWNLLNRLKEQWKWMIFPSNFESKRIEELTLLQCWTIRPVIPAD